jgi:ribose-phosphate pyrophosphokinase
MVTVIAGPGQPAIGKQLAELVDGNLITVEHKFFPDGERDMVLSSEDCENRTIIVQSITPPQDANLHSLLQLTYTAKEFGAKKITLVTPYLAYAAKDRRILTGEVVSIKNILQMIEASPATGLYVIDIHNPEVLAGKESFYTNFSAMPAFGRYYQEKELVDPLVLAPDKGAKERVSIIAKIMGCESDYFKKTRDPVTGETKTIPHELPVEGRDVIIADESIRTGGTIAKAIAALKEMDVGRIFVASTHLLLVNEADKRLLKAGAEELIGTDSLPSKYDKIKTAPLIYEQLTKQ